MWQHNVYYVCVMLSVVMYVGLQEWSVKIETCQSVLKCFKVNILD